MRKLLRWGGLAIAVCSYLALTVWTNTSPGETAISHGESATQSGMQPFWIVIYIGVAMLIASWFVPRTGPVQATAREDDSDRLRKGSGSPERRHTELTAEGKRRVVANLREAALRGNLRMRKPPDSADEISED